MKTARKTTGEFPAELLAKAQQATADICAGVRYVPILRRNKFFYAWPAAAEDGFSTSIPAMSSMKLTMAE